ncbi:hypothetical protein SNEBB_010810 [Seison nebaliae]|nr:hypothetical protein SNEBB_010810 [Seison nebaliae]
MSQLFPFLIVSFILLIQSVRSDPIVTGPPILCRSPGKEYTIEPLVLSPFWAFKKRGACFDSYGNSTVQCYFYLSFCRILPEDKNIGCLNSCGCISDIGKESKISIASYSTAPFHAVKNDGFYAEFNYGDNFTDPTTGKTCQLRTFVYFHCDKDSKWDPATRRVPGFVDVTFQESQCLYEIDVNYDGACVKVIPPPKKTSKLSSGSILLIIGFVMITSYMLIGMTYNMLIMKKSGIQAVPSLGLFLTVIMFIKIGVAVSLRKLGITSNATYDTVE